jgi:hypothetical protein
MLLELFSRRDKKTAAKKEDKAEEEEERVVKIGEGQEGVQATHEAEEQGPQAQSEASWDSWERSSDAALPFDDPYDLQGLTALPNLPINGQDTASDESGESPDLPALPESLRPRGNDSYDIPELPALPGPLLHAGDSPTRSRNLARRRRNTRRYRPRLSTIHEVAEPAQAIAPNISNRLSSGQPLRQ